MLINLLADLQDMAAETEWMSWALCSEIDPELFFPEKGGSPRRAKQICANCPVRQECLEYALKHGDTGVWGGTTESQRERTADQPFSRVAISPTSTQSGGCPELHPHHERTNPCRGSQSAA